VKRDATSDLTSIHLLCGAGGCSHGYAAAGWRVVLGANHWDRAIETHAANFPDAEHLCVDLNHYDMRHLPKARVLVGSPICYESSPADGVSRATRRQIPGQMSLFDDGPVPDKAWERTRATAYDLLRAAEVHRFDAVAWENVPRFVTAWPLFDWWVDGFRHLGYHHQLLSVNAAHVGGPGNEHAAQWRDRCFGVFTREGVTPPDLSIHPGAWCPTCETDVAAFQSLRPGKVAGRYRQAYDYRCPNTRCAHRIVEPYVNPAASIIDWTNTGTRIGDRADLGMRPLAQATVRKIRLGLDKHRVPTVITVNHTDAGDGRAVPAHTTPLATRTLRIGEGLALPGSFITELRGGGSTTRAIGDPLATVTAGGNHHGLVIPYRRGTAKTTGEPVHTIATRESAGLVLAAARPDPGPAGVEDCHFRMLGPREHLRAQRFADTYTVLGNVGEQTAQAGNAVPANVAQHIATQLAKVLA
jgi:DNA (cytosine-5)-methyltransferase 1